MSNAPDRTRAIVQLLLLVALLVAAGAVAQRYAGDVLRDPAALAERIRAWPGAYLLFVLVYAGATSLALPATPFTLAGGVIFGFAGGSIANWIGASIGATGSYLLARTLGADSVRALLGRHADKLNWLSAHTTAVTILRLRLIPIVPFDGISVAAGLAGVALSRFAVGTVIGIIPGTLIYTWFAESLMAGATDASRRAFARLAISGTLLVLLSFLPNIVRWLRSRRHPER